jgi:hypothetical protein
MAHRMLPFALAAGTAIGIATFAHAQGGVGGSGITPGAFGEQSERFANPPPRGPIIDEPSGTTGQGPGTSRYAPQRSVNPPVRRGEPRGRLRNEERRRGSGYR